MDSRPTRHRVALVLALLGLAVSGVILDVDRKLATDTAYTSFCNLGGVVNCDVVLSSRYGRFLDVPVALWAAAAFVSGVLAALPGAFFGLAGGIADLALIALASGALGFSAVLALVMTKVLGHVCLLCFSLDVVVVAWFVTVFPLARRFQGSSAHAWLRRRTVAYATAVGALALAIAGGTFAAVYTPGPASTAAEVEARAPEFAKEYLRLPVIPTATLVSSDSPSRGPADAAVTIVEFSDFECPACGQAYKDLHDLLHRRSDVRFVFRNFPLDSSCNEAVQRTVHPDACLAAIAGACAAKQSRFWEYHDRLFENQHALDRDSLFRYAREVGIDLTTFRTCLDDPAVRARIADDARAGIAAGIESTPTLFINGRRVSGALERPYYDYALVLESEHASASTGRP
jgi:protein-disulfide isomerase/uncharacterized membrane protein